MIYKILRPILLFLYKILASLYLILLFPWSVFENGLICLFSEGTDWRNFIIDPIQDFRYKLLNLWGWEGRGLDLY